MTKITFHADACTFGVGCLHYITSAREHQPIMSQRQAHSVEKLYTQRAHSVILVHAAGMLPLASWA
jgi:hypothetical protein